MGKGYAKGKGKGKGRAGGAGMRAVSSSNSQSTIEQSFANVFTTFSAWAMYQLPAACIAEPFPSASGTHRYFQGEAEPPADDQAYQWAHRVFTALHDPAVATAVKFDPAASERTGCVVLDRVQASRAHTALNELLSRLDDMPEARF
jgi:hypothetical protein